MVRLLGMALVLGLCMAGTLWAKGRPEGEPFRKGFTYLKWGRQFPQHAARSFAALQKTGAEWVSFVPIEYMDTVTSTDIYAHPVLTPRAEDLEKAIHEARAHGFKVLLKPHVDVMRDPWKDKWPGRSGCPDETAWMAAYRAFVDRYPIPPGAYKAGTGEQNWFRQLFSWRGEILPANEADMARWFAQYRRFILAYARLAQKLNVDLFCVGTEFEKLSDRTAEWESIVADVRKVYHGPIFYDANHDGFRRIRFWHKVDYLGLSGYFPISTRKGSDLAPPSDDEMRATLNRALDDVDSLRRDLSRQHGREFEVLLGEAGYTDFRGTARAPWDFILPDGFSPEEQARCYRVTLDVYKKRPWLKGVFLWRWSVEPEDAYFDYDHFSPHGKPAEAEIRKAWLDEGRG